MRKADVGKEAKVRLNKRGDPPDLPEMVCAHLHNGDPLQARTVHVPSGRPVVGSPPFTWRQSALDALTLKGFHEVGDWSVPHMLYLLEKYNGTAYADMAALLSAKVQADAGDLKNARVPLAWTATKANDPALRELARLRLATVLFDDKAYDEALAQLQAPTDESLVARFADLKGDILLAQGKREEAKAAYKAVVADLEKATKGESAALREIAQAKLDAVGGAQ